MFSLLYKVKLWYYLASAGNNRCFTTIHDYSHFAKKHGLAATRHIFRKKHNSKLQPQKRHTFQKSEFLSGKQKVDKSSKILCCMKNKVDQPTPLSLS